MKRLKHFIGFNEEETRDVVFLGNVGGVGALECLVIHRRSEAEREEENFLKLLRKILAFVKL
jgi:hypothetical protein